jgi:hypothetical protein
MLTAKHDRHDIIANAHGAITGTAAYVRQQRSTPIAKFTAAGCLL